jgi:hypothetical protein
VYSTTQPNITSAVDALVFFLALNRARMLEEECVSSARRKEGTNNLLCEGSLAVGFLRTVFISTPNALSSSPTSSFSSSRLPDARILKFFEHLESFLTCNSQPNVDVVLLDLSNVAEQRF